MGAVPAGRLNRRVRLEVRSAGRDALGQPTGGWVPVATVWGNVKTMTGMAAARNEVQAGGTEVTRATTSIRIRWRAGVDHGMRAVIGESIYDIRDVLMDEMDREFIDLACTVGSNDGG